MADIKQAIRAGVRKAFEAAASVVVTIEVRLGPKEADYDAATDKADRTWEQASKVEAIPFNDESFRKRITDPTTRIRSYVIRGEDITASDPTETGEIVEEPGGHVWQIVEMTIDPAGGAWILHCIA